MPNQRVATNHFVFNYFFIPAIQKSIDNIHVENKDNMSHSGIIIPVILWFLEQIDILYPKHIRE
jgi:hypothetical protein